MPNDGNNEKGLTLQHFAELLARLSDQTTQFAAQVVVDLRILQEKQDAQNDRIAKLELKITEREAVEAGEVD